MLRNQKARMLGLSNANTDNDSQLARKPWGRETSEGVKRHFELFLN